MSWTNHPRVSWPSRIVANFTSLLLDFVIYWPHIISQQRLWAQTWGLPKHLATNLHRLGLRSAWMFLRWYASSQRCIKFEKFEICVCSLSVAWLNTWLRSFCSRPPLAFMCFPNRCLPWHREFHLHRILWEVDLMIRSRLRLFATPSRGTISCWSRSTCIFQFCIQYALKLFSALLSLWVVPLVQRQQWQSSYLQGLALVVIGPGRVSRCSVLGWGLFCSWWEYASGLLVFDRGLAGEFKRNDSLPPLVEL